MSKSLRPRDSLLPSRAVSSSIDTMPTPVHADVHCTAGMTSWVWDLPSSGAHSMQHQLFASQGTTWGRTDRDMVGQVFTKQWPIFRRSVGRECLKLSKWLTRSYQLNFRFASSEHKSTLSLVNFRVLWQPFWIFEWGFLVGNLTACSEMFGVFSLFFMPQENEAKLRRVPSGQGPKECRKMVEGLICKVWWGILCLLFADMKQRNLVLCFALFALFAVCNHWSSIAGHVCVLQKHAVQRC